MISVKRIISECLGMSQRFAAIVLVAMAIVSCSDDRAGDNASADSREGYITIELSSSSLRTRADEAGVDNLNENLIERALVCLMPTTAAGDDDTPVFQQTVTFSSNTQSTATVQLRLSRELVNALFPNGATTATAYVIANLPNTAEYADAALRGKTLGELRALNISSNFASSANQPSFVMDGTSTEIELEANPDDIAKSTVTGEVPLTRVAAKITLGVKITTDKVVDDAGREWSPVGGSMSVLISNGVKTSAVLPSAHELVDGDYYNTTIDATAADERGRGFVHDENADFPYTQSKSFYTYPNQWGNDDATMTYMTLVVQWQSGTTYRTCYYMVPVVSKTNVDGIVRNVSYHVNVNIGILGSTDPDNPFELPDVSYRAVDWGIEEVGVSIDDFRYLVVDKTDYVVNNEAVVDIPFYSSHETTITNTKVIYYLYNFSAEGNEEAVEITEQQNERSTTTLNGTEMTHIYSSSVDNTINSTTGMRTLTFNHPLYQWTPRNNIGGRVFLGPDASGTYPTTDLTFLLNQIYNYSRTEELAFCRYDIEITLVHTDKKDAEDKELYTKTIKITQYPSMYIEVKPNGGGSYVGSTPVDAANPGAVTGTEERNYGNVFVNPQSLVYNGKPYILNDLTLGGVRGLVGTTNGNMYVINVSQLDVSSMLNIGDPRSLYINNDLSGNDNLSGAESTDEAGDWCNTASALYPESSGSRKLTYYYPADESNDKKSMVAPKIRVASSYGSCSPFFKSYNGRTNARRRAATYQEQGCPAGRWRLPTYGEFVYIVKLSIDGKIPALFSKRYGYVTANGIYHIDSQTNEIKEGCEVADDISPEWIFMRPVYDEWYWEQYTSYPGTPGTYTFGDIPRSVAP